MIGVYETGMTFGVETMDESHGLLAEETAKELLALIPKAREDLGDGYHRVAEDIICGFLRSIGHANVADAYEELSLEFRYL